MRYITRTILSIFCALALLLAPVGAHAADPLADAINNCDAGEIQRLFTGEAVGNMDPEGNTYLHYAVASCDSAEIVNIFANAGADINAKGLGGLTPLHLAAAEGQTNTALALIKARANVSEKDAIGSTPLLMAAGRGHIKTAILLIKAGADVNAKNEDGLTSLHIAALSGHTETVKLLIKAGANINAEDTDGSTPLEYAIFGLSFGAAYALMFP